MATLNQVGMDANGQFRIAAPGDIIKATSAVVVGSTPTVAAQTAAGTGASASIIGTNKAGKVTLVTGTLSLATGFVLRLSFADGLTFPTGSVCTFSAANDNFAGVYSQLYTQGQTTYVDLYVRGLALAVGTTYIGYYEITGY